MLSLNISSSSLNIIRIRGIFGKALIPISISFVCLCRWHDHDANEIQHHADLCIEQTIKTLEASGWAKSSVKVIGMSTLRPDQVAKTDHQCVPQESRTNGRRLSRGVRRPASHCAKLLSGPTREQRTPWLTLSRSLKRLESK